MWGQIAQDLLDAAADALDDGDTIRKVVQVGPDFRRDCDQLAVSFDGNQQVNQPNGASIPGGCASMTSGTFRVWLTRQCVPASAEMPPEADVTAFSVAFLDEARGVHVALLDACGPIARRCGSVAVGDGSPSGPTGGYMTYSWPVPVAGI